VASEAGYAIFLCEARERSRDRHINALLERQIDGIMIDALGAASLTEKLLERTNVVLIDEPPGRWPGVASDALGAGKQAAEHLLALGHERFAFLGPATDIHAIRLRERGFVQTIAKAGFKIRSDRLRRVPATASGGQTGMRALLALEPRPTAVFCSNDMVAIGALKTCSVARARVPADISIVGCDDIELASLTHPELTTVVIPARELGARAARLLLHALKTEEQEGRVETPVQKTIPSRLVVRGTTAPPPGNTPPT
jgi:LacI family transcriptional regulator, galactose operon repressor